MDPTAHDDAATGIAAILNQWSGQLAGDHTGYLHHAIRVVRVADLLHLRAGGADEDLPSGRPEFVVAAAFHDLGIWSDGTWDYLPPSVARARQWLVDTGHEERIPLVTTMIDEHHKLRSAGDPLSAVELFRKADAVDFSVGAVSFGLPRREYRALRREFPEAGFHRTLVRVASRNLLRHPLRPAPMVKF
ncbi:hypothetical protein ACWEKT_31355 [Nocardia takedensis]|uniref:hypothetical protein n=1 Tax=Nocardia takedensis TaxID=259390 RepID=UPI0002F7A3AA|nr:hypothetical protein [Nocardia takedensis]